MSYTQSFSVSQSISNLALMTVVDTSTGTDAAITQRRIFLQKYDGTYLVPSGTNTNYIDFPLSDGSSITINVLNKDYALNITVQWLGVTNNVLYTLTALYCFDAYSKTFGYQLTQYQTSNRALIYNANFWDSKSKLTELIDSAEQAIILGGDISSAQLCLDDAAFLVNNQQTFY